MSPDLPIQVHRLGVIQPKPIETLRAQWHREGRLTQWGERPQPLSPAEQGFQIDYLKDLVRLQIDYICSLIDTAGRRGIELVLLPECQFLGTLLRRPGHRDTARRFFSFTVDAFLPRCRELAKQHAMIVANCLFEARGDALTNECVIIDELGEIAGAYQKAHLTDPIDAQLSEAGLLEQGRSLTPIPTRIGKVGPLICYDIAFPEAALCYGLQGVDILLHPSTGGAYKDEDFDLERARQRVRASDNHVSMLYANHGSPSHGMSCVISSSGVVLACAGEAEEAIIYADVPVSAARLPDYYYPGYNHRQVLVAKRRPDLYGVIAAPIPPLLENWAPRRPAYRLLSEVSA